MLISYVNVVWLGTYLPFIQFNRRSHSNKTIPFKYYIALCNENSGGKDKNKKITIILQITIQKSKEEIPHG